MMRRLAIAAALPMVSAIVFLLALPAQNRVNESSDYAAFYQPTAERILAGEGITTETGAVSMRTPPGYPIILAATLGAGRAIGLSDDLSLDALMLVCVAASSLLLLLIAQDLWKGWLALLPSVVWSTYPLGLWLTKQPNSEVPFTVVLFALALAIWRIVRSEESRPWLIALAGVLGGIAMLIRPISVLLPFVCAALVILLATAWSRRRRVVAAAAIVGASALVIAPWEVYASRAAGHFVLLSVAGVPTMRDGLTFAVNPGKQRASTYVPDVVRTVMIEFYAHYDELDSYGDVARVASQQLRRHPGGMIGLLAFKLVRAWYGTDSQRLDRYIALLQAAYLALLVWAGRAAWIGGGDRRRLVIIALAIVGYFWLMGIIALPLVRYLVPAIGLSFVLVPAALERRGAGRS